MKKLVLIAGVLLLASFNSQAQMFTCPDPKTTSLKWGEPPAPWVVNPFSPHQPQGDVNTRFVRANILVAVVGRGVVCTYKNSIGIYSIWWQVLVKIPPREDYNWIDTNGGFVCTDSIRSCQFSVAVVD